MLCWDASISHTLPSLWRAAQSPPPVVVVVVVTSPHRCSREGFLTNSHLPAQLHKSVIGPWHYEAASARLYQWWIVLFVLANISALMTCFLRARVALPAALTFTMRLLIITRIKGKGGCVSEGIAMALVYSLLVSEANPLHLSLMLKGAETWSLPHSFRWFSTGRVLFPVISVQKLQMWKHIAAA